MAIKHKLSPSEEIDNGVKVHLSGSLYADKKAIELHETRSKKKEMIITRINFFGHFLKTQTTIKRITKKLGNSSMALYV